MSIHDGLNHQCDICGHTSKSRDALRKHLAYRHLIGMSGPVRPRMPAGKRRKGGTDGEADGAVQSSDLVGGAEHVAASTTPTLSDADNSAGEETGEHARPSEDVW